MAAPSSADFIRAIDPDSVSSCCLAIVSAAPPASRNALSSSRIPSVFSVNANTAGAASTPNSFIASDVSIPAAVSMSRTSAKVCVSKLTSDVDSPMAVSRSIIDSVGFNNRENAPRNAVPACSPLNPALYSIPRMPLTSSISIPIAFATGPTYFRDISSACNVALLEPMVFAKTSATRLELSIPSPNCPSVDVTTSVVFARSF